MIISESDEVQGAIGEAICPLVLFSGDVGDRERPERAKARLGFGGQRTEFFVLDAILPEDLADDQLGIHEDVHLIRPERAGLFQTSQERPVLGDVVGGAAQALADFAKDLAPSVQEGHTDRRRAGIAPGSAVRVQTNDHPVIWLTVWLT